ncbi:cell wall protein DAN4-like [Larimichthys crocea]|uniref:cell wall protein DAN4-like n=1 Tax=Larimichthys crocea TaxID=215358 RepID=UPI000F5DA8F0|nr:cell wall protein DAN4-like [Larimichthys crocea]
MKMKLVYVPMMMALVVTTTGVLSTTTPTTTTKRTTTPTTTTKPTTKPTTTWTTRGPHGLNLIGKMFTLPCNSGGISFYSSDLSPSTIAWLYTSVYPTRRYKTRTTATTFPRTPRTKPWTTTTPRTTRTTPWTTTTPQTTRTTPRTTLSTTSPAWTTAPPTRGVSVCLRYLTDYIQVPGPAIFTLISSSSSPISLTSYSGLWYGLTFNYYNVLFLQPKIRFWSNIGPDIWTRLCLTVDTVKNVAQVFSGPNISIRKILPIRYVWSGQPVIDFSGFDGQVTDVQIWDYPLHYREIYNYMVSGVYGPHRGSILTWSSISYSPRGNVVMEDVYEQQSKQSLSSGGSRERGRHLKGKKKTRKFWNLEEKKARKRQRM